MRKLLTLRRSKTTLTALVAAVFIMAGAPAWAHKVNVYVYAEGDIVHVRGYFSKNPARNCKILVFTSDGTQITEGKTDRNGEFTFRTPVRADLKVQIIAGEGHTNNYILKASELPEGLPNLEEWDPAGHAAERDETCAGTREQPGQKSSEPEGTEKLGTRVSLHEIEEIVEKVVERKVAPLRKMLLEQQERAQGATFERVIAGLGIIFGFMGLTMYLRSIRRKKGAGADA